MLENIVAQIKKYEQIRNKKITLAMVGVLFSMLGQMTEQQFLAIPSTTLQEALSLLLQYKSEYTSPDMLLRHCEQVITLIDRLHLDRLPRQQAAPLREIEDSVKSYLFELQQRLRVKSVKEDSQLDWRNDIQRLWSVREQAMRTTHILDTQKELTTTHYLILRKMFKRAELVLGAPGFRYSIMCLGPLSRGDASTSLALQCHVLIEDISPANYAYIEDLFTVLQSELLGVDKEAIDLEVYPHINVADHLQATGIVTIESGVQAIEQNCEQAIEHADAKCLYGDEALLKLYQQTLNQALSSAEKKIKETLLQTGQIFKSAPWQQGINAAKGIDLVHECLMPLCNAIMRLRRYYGVTDLPAHPLMLVNAFISRGHWSEEFGNACREGLGFLYQLELQQTNKQNRDHSKQNQGMGWQRRLMSIIEKMLKPMGLMMLWLGEANAQAELFNLIKKSRLQRNNHAAQTLIGMTLDFLRNSRAEELKSLSKQMLIELVQEFNIQAKQWILDESVLINNYRLLVMLVEKISDLQAQDIELLLLQMELKLQAGLYFTRPVQQLSQHSSVRLMTADFLNIYFGITNLVEVHTWLVDNPLQNKAAMTQDQIEQTIDSAMQNIYATVARYWKQNVPTSNTHWRNYRRSLQQLRQELNAQTEKGFTIEDLHAATAQGANIRELSMLKQCSLYLGKFSGIMIFIKFGSGSERGDPTSTSDTECAVVYLEDPNPAHQRLQEEYIHDLLRLWELEMLLLGESGKNHAGVHLDLPPRIELTRDPQKPRKKFAVVTVDAYIDWLRKAFYEDYTRLIPTLLYSSDLRGNQLYDYLMQHLRPYPDLPMQKEFLKVVNLAFRSACWNQPNFVAFTSVNIKADFIRVLILAITQLIFYYEIKDVPSHHPLHLLQLLIDRGYLAKDYGEAFKEALEFLYKLRNDHQLTNGVQSEDRKEMVLWVPRFQQIIDEVLKPFQVLLKAMGDGLAKDDLVTLHPWNFPDKRGVRLSVIMAEKQWQQQIKDELVTAQPNPSLPRMSIKTAEGHTGYLPGNVVRYLLDKGWINELGQFKLEAKKSSEKEGTHLVHNVKTQNTFFFFKIFPLDFMEEFDTGTSADLLVGRRGKYGCTPKVENALIEVNGAAYPVTISQPIDGEDLAQKFKDQQANDLVLEKRGFAERVVLGMNVNPGDNQPQNDKVVRSFNPYTQQQEARFICIDSEVNGGPSVVQEKEEVKITIVEHHYCSDAMKDTFHQGLAYELKHIDPYLLLMELLAICEKKEQQIRKLYTEKQITVFFKESAASLLQKRMRLKTDVPESSLLVMSFRENVMEERFLGLSRLLTLIQNKDISYLEALCATDPYVGNFYKKLHAKYDTVERRFNEGPALFYGQDEKSSKTSSAPSTKEATVSAHQTKMTKLLSLRTGEGKPVEVEKLLINSSIKEARERLEQVHQQYNNLKIIIQAILAGKADIIKEFEQLSSHDVRERIFNQLDWSQIKSNTIDKLLKMMTKTRFRRLRIINCDALTDEILEKILKHSPGLEELTLRNCRNVGKIGRNSDKDNLFQMLSRHGKMLVCVHLDSLPSLFVREGTVAIPSLERLRELSIKNCVNLNKLILQADELILLQLATLNPALSYRLQVSKLTTLDLSAWQNFREEDLKSMVGNLECDNLTTIKFAPDCSIDSQQMTLLKRSPLFITRKIYNLAPDAIMKLFEILDSSEGYKHLNNGLPKETLVALAANKSFKVAHVICDEIDEEYLRLLGRMLHLNNTLASLIASRISIDKTKLINISRIIPALQMSKTLQSVELTFIAIADAGAMNIADVLRTNGVLRALGLSYCKIGQQGAAALADALHFNATLESFDISNNEVTIEGAFALVRAFIANSSLKSINVYSHNSYHGIGLEGAQLYAQLLEQSSTLTHLNLGGPGLSIEGIAVIARAMIYNRILRILELHNVIGVDESHDPPFLPFAEVVRRNNTLLRLDLSDNKYAMGKDATEIARALSSNSTLTSLDMSSNYNLYLALVEFAQALEINKTLLEADFSNTGMDLECCRAMARMLEINRVLTAIHLSGGGKKDSKSKGNREKFGIEGTQLLIRSLQRNRSLTSFGYFNGANVDEHVQRDIAVLLTLNSTIVYMPLLPNMEQYCEVNNNRAANMRRAIFEKQAIQVSNYLSQGVNIFALDNSSNKIRNILQLIAISGDLPVLRFLLELLQRENLSIKGMILFYSYEKLTAIEYAKLYGHHKIAAILEKCLASDGNKIDLARIFAEVNIAYDLAPAAVVPAADISTAFTPSAFIPMHQALQEFQVTPGISSTPQQASPTIRAVSQNASLGEVNNSSAIKPPLSAKEKMLDALNRLKAQEVEVTQPPTPQNVSARSVSESPKNKPAVRNTVDRKPPLSDKEKMLAALNQLVVQGEGRVDQHEPREQDDQDVQEDVDVRSLSGSQKIQNFAGTHFFPEVQDDEDAGVADFRPDDFNDQNRGVVDFRPHGFDDLISRDEQFYPAALDIQDIGDMQYFSDARDVGYFRDTEIVQDINDDHDEIAGKHSRKASKESSEAQYIPFAEQMERDDPFSARYQKTSVDKLANRDKIINASSFGIPSSASPFREETKIGAEIKYKFAIPLPAVLPVKASAIASPTRASPPVISHTIKSPQNNATFNAGGNVAVNSGGNTAINTGGNAALKESSKGSWTTVTPRTAVTKNQPILGVAQPVDRTASSPSLKASAAISRSTSAQELSPFDTPSSLKALTAISGSPSSNASAVIGGSTPLHLSSASPSLAVAPLSPLAAAIPSSPASSTPSQSWSPSVPARPKPSAPLLRSGSPTILGSRGSAGKTVLPETMTANSPNLVTPNPALPSTPPNASLKSSAPTSILTISQVPEMSKNASPISSSLESSSPTAIPRMMSKPPLPKAPLPATPSKGAKLSTGIFSPAKPMASASPVSSAAASPGTTSPGTSTGLPATQPTKP